MADTTEKIDDPEELAQVRRQARSVRIKSAAVGLLLTFIAVLIP